MVILIEKLLLHPKDLHLYDQAFITHCAGPAESVRLLRFWPDQLFLKVKAKFLFCKRQIINKVLV